MASLRFRHFISGSLVFVSIGTYLTKSCFAFSVTLTTVAFDHSSLRWFEACSCKPAPRGLPSSSAKHGAELRELYSFLAHAGSAGGISPPAAHRTVHKPLDLHGSYQPFSCSLTANKTTQESQMLIPVSRLAKLSFELIYPLRSISITETSSLLRDNPPPSCSSVLSPFVFYTYKVFP